MDIITILVLLITVLVYIIYRLWPDEMADAIRNIVFDEVSDEVLDRFIKASTIQIPKVERIHLSWNGWDDQRMEIVMNVLCGFGEAFRYALSMKKFYFRELLREIGSVKVVRAWIMNAVAIGLIKISRDSQGVRVYEVDREGLEAVRDYIINALRDLL
mgnify:CR=1 FL=1